nr:MAM domain-containing protein 2-like [Pocillopora verrucosa]
MPFYSYKRITCATLFLLTLRPFWASNSTSVLSPDCDFDNSTLCNWENDKTGIVQINWIVRSGATPSQWTGPQSDVSGHGRYAYVEASGRNHGDRARLISPKMQGPKCLSVWYHMYGSSMGSLIIYLKTNDSEMIQWIKSGNHPDQWLQAAVFVNSSVEYQIVVEAIRGWYFASDIAIDNIILSNGKCQNLGK